MYVGITEEMICAETSLSPFFWPSAESADDMFEAICIVQRMFKTLKPDLRPNSEQINFKHHPYIDILPVPTLRKNLITHQEEIDEDEFFQDIFTGLVCWGGAGIGRKDREDSTGYASTGTPWDVRSWEARVWFLQKYWTLLGGEDGELVRQSEWWRTGAVSEGRTLLKFGPQMLVQGVPSLLPACHLTSYNTVLRHLYLVSPDCLALLGSDSQRKDVKECHSMIFACILR